MIDDIESESVGCVVIVDDNSDNLRALKAILDTQGYDTFAAINGKLAIQAISSVKPDVILLDIMMPDMNGYQVCEQLKAGEKTQHIPVIFISALDDTMDKVKAFETGGVDYILKPFEAEEVLARVKTHVALSRVHKELEASHIQLQKFSRYMEEANKERESFCYAVSHDLLAPLRRISSFSLIIREDYSEDLTDEINKYLLKIETGVSFMGELINSLLDLSRVGRRALIPEQVNLSNAAQLICEQLAAANSERKVKISIEPDLFALCDEGLVNVVLTNFLSNAWKFTSKIANPEIEFGSVVKEGEDVFFIRDNGAGFDMKYADKLFQPFQRLCQTKDFAGTGIGLATVQRVINMHGGRVWAQAKPDEGATFYFLFS